MSAVPHNQAQAFAVSSNRPYRVDESFWRRLTVLLLAGLTVRVVILRDYLSGNVLAEAPLSDAQHYWDWAGALAAGDWLREIPFFSAPLYPYLLGLFRAAGGTLPVLYWLQTAAILAAIVLVARVAAARYGSLVGLCAAGILLFTQEVAGAGLRVLTNAPEFVLTAIVWAGLVGLGARQSVVRLLGAGVAIGLLALTYAPALLLLPAAGLWVWWLGNWRPVAAGRGGALVLTGLVVISPATWHNWQASDGELIVVRSGGGITLRQGNHPSSVGVYTPLPGISTSRSRMHTDAAARFAAETGEDPTYNAIDRHYRELALTFWAENPLTALQLAGKKLYLFFTAQRYADIYPLQAEIAAGLTPTLWLTPLQVPWVLAPALVGLVIVLRGPRRAVPELLLIGIPLLVTVVFFYSPRYRFPALPLVGVLAAVAVIQAIDWKRYPLATASVAVLLVAGVLSDVVNARLNIDRPAPAQVTNNLLTANLQLGQFTRAKALADELRGDDGSVQARRISIAHRLRDEGQFELALEMYERAAADNPDDLSLVRIISEVLLELNQPVTAQQRLDTALAQAPERVDLLVTMAEVQRKLNNRAAALEYLARAGRQRPTDPEIGLSYGVLLLQMQRPEQAYRVLSQVARAAPNLAQANYQAGVAALTLRRVAEAAEFLEQAQRITPESEDTLYSLGIAYLELRRPVDAVAVFERAAELAPNNAIIRRALAQARAQVPQ